MPCLVETGAVTLRKRCLPFETTVWCIVDMAEGRKEPLHQIVNRLDIVLSGNRPCAVILVRQRMGGGSAQRVFTQTVQLWHNSTPHAHCCGLTLLAIDGVF